MTISQDDAHLIPMLGVDQVDAQSRKHFETASERGAPDSGVLRILAHEPGCLDGFVTLWWACFDGGTVEHATKELLRVKLADKFGCGYCGTVRSKRAKQEGLTEERILAACQPGPLDPDEFSERERLVLEWGRRLADGPGGVDDELTARMKNEFTDAQLVELGALAAMCIGFDTLFPTWGIGAHTCQVVGAQSPEAA
jgi:alkylhydroperoxidase family enzyme